MSDEVLETRAAQWQRVRGKMLAEFGDGVFRSWLKPMVLANSNTSSVTISVPTRFMRDRVNAIYGDRLRALWSAEKVDTVELVVAGRDLWFIAASPIAIAAAMSVNYVFESIFTWQVHRDDSP